MKCNKRFFTLILLSLVLTIGLFSCSTDDESSSDSEIVNIKFDITTTRNTSALVNRTLNNDTETDEVNSLPYSFTYAQEEVDQGSFVKITYQDNGVYNVTNEGSSWTDYDAVLTISVDNNVVKTESFLITEGTGNVQIDYTF